MVIALGYEGPGSVGTLAAAGAVLVVSVVLVWLAVRVLVAFFSDDRAHGR